MSGIGKKELLIYETPDGKAPFEDWLGRLTDRRARALIRTHLDRLEWGHAGKNRQIKEGISELRIYFGPGYRVYCGEDRGRLIILLCGGDKKSQLRDIKRALEYWRDYKARK